MTELQVARRSRPAGAVRVLKASEMPLLRDHLLRLDAASRRDRFNGVVDDDFLIKYAGGCSDDGVIVIGYIEDGEVHAAAELHEPKRSPDEMPEIAFSVEQHLRRRGVGSVLFKALLAEAKRHGYRELRVTTGAQNDAMRALARKFGTKLKFSHGELSGNLDLAAARVGSSPLNPFEASRHIARGVYDLNRALWSAFLGVRAN
jgi:GNAT superfamily N-acetyltransferase